MCQLSCERYCEVQLGIALLVHERCHLDGLFDDELLVWSVTLQLQSDIISYLGDLRIWLIPFLGLRLEQMVIEDDPIDEDCNSFDELGIADADSDAAVIVSTVPALSNVMLCVDAAFHRLSAVVAPNEVTEQVDGIVFLFASITLTSDFQVNCRLVHFLIYDGIIFFCSCIFGVVDDPCNTGLIPYSALLRIRNLVVGQLVSNRFQGSSVQIRFENFSDNFRFFSGDDRSTIAHCVSVWDIPRLFHDCLLYAFPES